MRRSVAIALLLLMLTEWLAPAAMATATNPLPACCRATGRHHCAAMAASMIPGGVRVQGQSCPQRKPLLFSGSASLASASETASPADPHPFLREFYAELFVSTVEQPHPERAPPPAHSRN